MLLGMFNKNNIYYQNSKKKSVFLIKYSLKNIKSYTINDGLFEILII